MRNERLILFPVQVFFSHDVATCLSAVISIDLKRDALKKREAAISRVAANFALVLNFLIFSQLTLLESLYGIR